MVNGNLDIDLDETTSEMLYTYKHWGAKSSMMDNLWLRGFILGLSIAAPVGPIGVLCIRRTLSDGQIAGLVSGLGAATADGVYGAIAGFGLTMLSGLIVQHLTWLQLAGGVFLCYLGIKTLLKKPVKTKVKDQKTGWLGAYASAFILTLTNPMTILSFAAVFASAGLSSATNYYLDTVTLILGVFAGSTTWWLALSGTASIFREKLTAESLMWINRISGVVITGFGSATLLNLVK